MTQRVRSAGRRTAGARTGARPGGDPAARRARLRAVVEPVVVAAGYDFEELTVTRVGRRSLVRVIVDGDAGVSLDTVAEISRGLSRALDEAEEAGGDLIAGEYQLEVSSPGVDRPLTEPRHWRRNQGRLVRVTARAPGERAVSDEPRAPGELAPGGDQATARSMGGADVPAAVPAGQLTGRILAADEERVTLELATGPARWRYPDLGPGRIEVEFGRSGPDIDDELTGYDDFDDDDFSDDDEVEGGDR